LYICLTGLALGIERLEGKLKIVLGRCARIDGAARELADGSVHATGIPLTHMDRRTGLWTGHIIEAARWRRRRDARVRSRTETFQTEKIALTHPPPPPHEIAHRRGQPQGTAAGDSS